MAEEVFDCCRRLVEVQWALGDRSARATSPPLLPRLGDHALPDQLTVLGTDVAAALQRSSDPSTDEGGWAEGLERAAAVVSRLHALRLRL